VGQTIACANQKGGVGKTTTVVNLGAYLALSGERVLVLDLDPQGNATSGLGLVPDVSRPSVYDAVVGDTGLSSVIVGTAVENLKLAPSSVALAGAEVELALVEQRERRTRRLIEPVIGDYDHVLIDCPPSMGLLTLNALTAASGVLIPLQCEYYALEGLSHLMRTLDLVRDHLNPNLLLTGVVLTMYDARTKLAADVAREARQHLGDRVFDTVIPRNVRLSEAPSHGLPIALYQPGSAGAEAYRAFADEFRRRADTPRSNWTERSAPLTPTARAVPSTGFEPRRRHEPAVAAERVG
jgi:chromosome partitioning protein